MNYQEVLLIPSVYSLINAHFENPDPYIYHINPSIKLKLLNIDNKFYLKDSKENLHFVQRDMKKLDSRVISLFETCIYAELSGYDILSPWKNPGVLYQPHLQRGKFDINLYNALCISKKQEVLGSEDPLHPKKRSYAMPTSNERRALPSSVG